MALLVAVVLVAVVGVACGPAGPEPQANQPQVQQIVLAGRGTVPPLPVMVVDAVGMVNAVSEEYPPLEAGFPAEPFARSVIGRPDVLVIGWFGGLCDRQVRIDVVPGDGDEDSELAVLVTTAVEQGRCELTQIDRQVVLVMSRVVDPSRVETSEAIVFANT